MQQYTCWFLTYPTETNPMLPWFLSKRRDLFYGHFLSNPNGILLMHVSYCKTLACLVICETIANSMKSNEVSQQSLLACQLGFFLALLLPQILHHFYTEGESAWKQCTFLWMKCGCHENWPHSDSVDTRGFSWEKSVVLAWQEQPLPLRMMREAYAARHAVLVATNKPCIGRNLEMRPCFTSLWLRYVLLDQIKKLIESYWFY